MRSHRVLKETHFILREVLEGAETTRLGCWEVGVGEVRNGKGPSIKTTVFEGSEGSNPCKYLIIYIKRVSRVL